MQYGLIIPETSSLDPRLYRFGGVSGLSQVVLQPDRNFRSFLPALELQNKANFDRMACVTYSAWNCCETLLKRKYNLDLNWSDRFTAKLSGTTAQGNSFYNVGESIRKLHGGVTEDKWPDVESSVDPAAGFSDYYRDVPEDIRKLGLEIFPQWKIEYESVWDDQDSLWEALQYAPIQVALYAYGPEVNGVVQRVETRGNHAVMLMNGKKGEWWEIFDHYAWVIKKLAWNTRFWGAVRYDISRKVIAPPPMYAFKEDTMYFVAEGKGVEFAQLGGKLRFDDPNKMSRQVAYRTKGVIGNRYETISLKELEGVTAYDLKGKDLGPARALAV